MKARERRVAGFVAAVFSIWGGGCLYLGWRCVEPLALPAPWRQTAWAAVLLAAVCVPVAMIRHRRRGAGRATLLAALLTMSLLAMLVPVSLVRDVLWLALMAGDALTRALGSTAHALPVHPAARADLARSLTLAVLAVGTAMAVAGLIESLRLPRIRRVAIPFRRLPRALEGFRIVLLTDLHAGGTVRRARIAAIVRLVNGLRPDLIALAGDIADGHVADLKRRVAPLADLVSRHGVFMCSGNHEYYWDPHGWLTHLPTLGLTLLSNHHRIVRHGAARLLVAGVPDAAALESGHGHGPNPARARRGAARHDFSLLLAHQPGHFAAAARAGYDLVVSGHTHGGQMWPWARIFRGVHPRYAGLFGLGESRLYVSRGAGHWGPPNRLGVPAEVILITLRRA